ncbi:MAG: hypothetical protein ACK47E_10785 [Cyclobacteriaceae bacterium]
MTNAIRLRTSILTLIIIHLVLFELRAQDLRIFKDFEAARKDSRESKRVLLVIINPLDVCKECMKSNVHSIIRKKSLSTIYSSYNIYFVRQIETEGVEFLKKYKLQSRFPLFIFLNEQEELLHTASGFSKEVSFYAKIHEEVQSFLKNGKGYVYYVKTYQKNKDDQIFLREYIEFLSTKNRMVPDSVLSAYLNSLGTDLQAKLETRVYILTKGVVLNGNVFNRMFGERNKLFDVLNTMPLQERVNVNNKIIQKTIWEAIQKRDTSIALQGARFAENSWFDKRRGYLSYLYNMRQFYGGVKDTISFLQKSSEIAELYLVRELGDSTIIVALKESKAQELNNIAYTTYQWTKDKEWLLKALNWSVLTIRIKERPEYLDTLAHLQYRTGQSTQSIDTQMRAISQAKKENINSFRYELELEKMKTGKL